MLFRFILLCIFSLFLSSVFTPKAIASKWRKTQDQDFHIIYQSQHAFLVPRVNAAAHIALERIRELFQYTPSEPIVLILRDYRDSGGARATGLPHNTITLDVAPFNQANYESIRFDEQFQWLLSHELVHIAMTDQASQAEQFLRNLTGKIEPQKNTPLTLPFSLLTNRNRFTPTWYQEGIATFMETWFNGGYGRVLGSYDEMYFRTLIQQGQWLDWQDVDHTSDTFLLGTNSYLYGARFMAHLAIRYDVERVLRWVRVLPEQGHMDFKRKFADIFAVSLDEEWKHFFQAERDFQKSNIERIQRYPLSTVQTLAKPMGWVTTAYRSDEDHLVYARLGAHKLAAIERLNLHTGKQEILHHLPTPGLVNIAATAFDPKTQWFFYTTHNDRGYRDLWRLNVSTGKNEKLMTNARIGNLAINPINQKLYGIRVSGAGAFLVSADAPYKNVKMLYPLPVGTQLNHLTIHPEGDVMLATLRQPQGEQQIVMIHLETLQQKGKLQYQVIANIGQPEHPSWSSDGETIYWSAYTNGVSNLYRLSFGASEVEVLSNTLTGLFHPLALDDKKLFAYRYTIEGFEPVILPNTPSAGLAAIHYRGQQVVELNPEVKTWRLPAPHNLDQKPLKNSQPYSGLKEMQKNALIPNIGAYAGQTAVGAFWEKADPLREHRFYLKGSFSFHDDEVEDWHLDSAYSYRDVWTLGVQHLPTSFYDLANRRDVRRVNNSVYAKHKKYWIYDRPRVMTQSTFIRWNDWQQDDFGESSNEETLSLGLVLNDKHTRKTIGSVGDEYGWQWNAELKYTEDLNETDRNSTRLFGDVHWIHPLVSAHNIFRVQIAAGKSWGDDIGENLFYFEGYGKQLLEENTHQRYRQLESLPGLNDSSQIADQFTKYTIENRFPPIKLAYPVGPSYLKNMDFSLFAQQLQSKYMGKSNTIENVGAQLNLYVRNFYVMDATVSLGYAKAWLPEDKTDNEVFFHIKLFRL